MRGRAIVLALACLAAGPPGGLELVASVDKTRATLEDTILLTVSVTSTDAVSLRAPALPDFHVSPAGQNRRVEIVNDRMSARTDYQFVLTPHRQGTFTIPALRVTVGGATAESQPIQVTIGPSDTRPASDEPVSVRAEVSAPAAYVGQRLVYTIQVIRRVQITQARLEPPSFGPLQARDLGEQREHERVIGGQRHLITEIRKAVVASKPGPVEISAPVLHCVVSTGSMLDDPFFGAARGRRVVVRGNAVAVDVKPLPQPAPAEFSGLIGEVAVDAQLSKQALEVGDSATLTMVVRADADPGSIPRPALPLPASVKVYEDRPVDQVAADGGSSQRTFKVALVPSEPGQIALPAPKVSYFDPATGTYRDAVAQGSFSLSVRPAPGGGGAAAPTRAGKQDVRVVGEDLLPIHARGEALGAHGITAPLAYGAAGLCALPGLALIGAWAARRRRQRAPDELVAERRGRALGVLRRDLKAAQAQGPVAACELVAAALRTFVGDRLGVPGRALGARDAAERLSASGVPAEVARGVGALLERCEAVAYGGAVPDAVGLRALVEEAGRLAQLIERAA